MRFFTDNLTGDTWGGEGGDAFGGGGGGKGVMGGGIRSLSKGGSAALSNGVCVQGPEFTVLVVFLTQNGAQPRGFTSGRT